MRVTKYGHSCFLVEEGDAKILFDPGNFSVTQNIVTGIHAVLITHEHLDHVSPDSLKVVLANNPNAVVYANEGVGKLLSDNGILFTRLGDRESVEVHGVLVEGFGIDHACIHDSLPLIRNTGYMIAGRLYYPGDSFHIPEKKVEILALPVAAPWLKISDAVDYAKKIMPAVCFPVHDGMLRPERAGSTRFVPEKILTPLGVTFRDAVEGSVLDF